MNQRVGCQIDDRDAVHAAHAVCQQRGQRLGALRIAALRLTGDLPTLAEIDAVAAAPDDAARRVAYEARLDDYLTRPTFAAAMFRFWQETLRLGADPVLDTAPAFLAQLAVENRSFLETFTATAGTCPTLDVATGAFTVADCGNGVPQTAGLLTHPGAMRQFYSNLAFRRVRWVQETFACGRFPAELAEAPLDVLGASPYTGRFPFESIAGEATGGRIDFRDVSSVTCANCHSTMNHIAPLFAHFDFLGNYSETMVVPVPIAGSPLAMRTDYLPDTELTAWRVAVPARDLPELGAAIAADPDVTACAIARLWNWALGKGDIVDTLAEVPEPTIRRQIDAFVAGGYRLRDAIRGVFTSDDFVRF